jgi:hypothetical protein
MELHRMFTKEELGETGANVQEIFRVQTEVRKLLHAQLIKSVATQADASPGTDPDRKGDSPSPL